jgi:hypothetical protein
MTIMKPSVRSRAPFAGLAGLALTALLGCQSAPAPPPHLDGPPAKILMVKDYAMQAVLSQDKHLASTFAGRETYVITTTDLSHPAALGLAGDVEPTATFTSYATFAADLAAGRLPRSYQAVVYDIEKWGQTPLAEQQNPRVYMLRFSELARAHGLFPILAPARDLVLVPGSACVKRGGENLSEAYIRCGLAGAVAHAGALVVQSQVDQFNVSAFRNFLTAATRQARAANPRVAVLATLATAPLGRSASIYQLVAAARSVAGMVQGYSLNIATSGTQTQTADALLWSFK